MLRVCSRQRLVSWDAFDATAGDDASSSEEYQTCLEEYNHNLMSRSSSWTTVGDLDTNACASTDLTVGGHKRDRAAVRRDSTKSERSFLIPRDGMDSAASLEQSGAIISMADEGTTPLLQLDHLAVDAQLHIMSFLDLASLRSIMTTGHCFRSLLMSKDAHFVWMDCLYQIWPKLGAKSVQQQQHVPVAIQVMDSMQLPTAAGRFEQEGAANVALLLSLAPSRHSTMIDTELFQCSSYTHNLRSLRRHQHHGYWNQRNNTSSPLFVMYEPEESNNNRHTFSNSIVQFRGEVGFGDQCIRAKEPLARPLRRAAIAAPHCRYNNHEYSTPAYPRSFLHNLPLTLASVREPHYYQPSFHHHHHNNQVTPPPAPQQQQPTTTAMTSHNRISLLDMICRGSKSVEVVDSNLFSYLHWRPFVTPHVVENPKGNFMLDLTPRMISYFEVSILRDTTVAVAEDASDRSEGRRPLLRTRGRSECVAVGVASHYFDLHSRMPGWDSFSFGYHGDDGGIFHASGVMLRPYGPCFGVGDTVGCGVDYTNGGIFFTLNSKFLGYAWTGISTSLYLQQDLYPVVGVDTHAPIACNFGERPFEFDLSQFLRQHADKVKEACGLINSILADSFHSSSSSKSSSTRRGRYET